MRSICLKASPQRFQFGFRSKPLLRVAVVRMQHRWIEQASFRKYRFVQQGSSQFCAFHRVDFPADDFGTVKVHHHVQKKEHVPDRSRQQRGIPAPHLICASGAKALRQAEGLRLSTPTAVVLLIRFVQNSEKARLRSDLVPFIGNSAIPSRAGPVVFSPHLTVGLALANYNLIAWE